MKINHQTTFVLIGSPACGKGTQREKLAKLFHMSELVMGDECRSLAKQNNELGQKIKVLIDNGKLISDKLVVEIVKKFLQNTVKDRGIIFDGIPRTVYQYQQLLSLLVAHGWQEPIAIQYLISERTAINRIGLRRVCQDCLKVYFVKENSKLIKEKCVSCGGVLKIRDDDNPASVKKRLIVYEKNTKPIITLFQAKDKLIQVDGEPSINKVWQNTTEALERF